MASTVTRSPARQNAPRGHTESNKGAPVNNPNPGPKFFHQIYPVRAKVPLHPRAGRIGSNVGNRNSSLTFDSSMAAHGYLSYRVTTGTYAGSAQLKWSRSLQGSWSTLYYRAYLYYTGNPPVASTPVSLQSGNSNAALITINSSGSLELFDSTGTGHNTFTNAIPLNSWFRIEGYVTGSTSGVISCTLFGPPNSTTVIETHTASAVNTLGLLTQITYGESNKGINEGPWWIDDIGVSNTGYLGPVQGQFPPPALSQVYDSIALPSTFFTTVPVF